ncbi:hypothetical protein LOB72_07685, partial [Lactobacillus delbrueckii subsp. lactis]|uniref:hypothetical protein n=1 Tax=Lactobacillus delbrueckii TaxID=1584 RepID=UPI001E28A744
TERTRHFLVKKPKKILQLRLEDKNVFNAIHLNSIGYVFEFGTGHLLLQQDRPGYDPGRGKISNILHIACQRRLQNW